MCLPNRQMLRIPLKMQTKPQLRISFKSEFFKIEKVHDRDREIMQ